MNRIEERTWGAPEASHHNSFGLRERAVAYSLRYRLESNKMQVGHKASQPGIGRPLSGSGIGYGWASEQFGFDKIRAKARSAGEHEVALLDLEWMRQQIIPPRCVVNVKFEDLEVRDGGDAALKSHHMASTSWDRDL